jgi:hypothetical protein
LTYLLNRATLYIAGLVSSEEAREGEEMKRHWLRGLVLGVSVALLLSGGVALARGLSITADKECVVCWPGQENPTESQYLMTLTFGGWNASLPLWGLITIDGEVAQGPDIIDPGEAPYSETVWLPCEWPEYNLASTLGFGGEATVATNGEAGPLGEWVFRIWQENPPGTVIDSAQASWVVAEDCSAYEFVPEPGSILLLGSGLAGLAGYATLRWRTRE